MKSINNYFHSLRKNEVGGSTEVPARQFYGSKRSYFRFCRLSHDHPIFFKKYKKKTLVLYKVFPIPMGFKSEINFNI